MKRVEIENLMKELKKEMENLEDIIIYSSGIVDKDGISTTSLSQCIKKESKEKQKYIEIQMRLHEEVEIYKSETFKKCIELSEIFIISPKKERPLRGDYSRSMWGGIYSDEACINEYEAVVDFIFRFSLDNK